MQYDQFVGQVQHRARVASRGEAVAAIRATLETLSERLAGGEAKDLASQLPAEIGMYLRNEWKSECTKLSLPEFYQRVSIRENMDPRKAIHHARSVMAVVQEAVSRGEIDDVRAQLPAEFSSLFELASEPEQPKAETSAPAEKEEMENPVLSTAPGYHPGGHRTRKAA